MAGSWPSCSEEQIIITLGGDLPLQQNLGLKMSQKMQEFHSLCFCPQWMLMGWQIHYHIRSWQNTFYMSGVLNLWFCKMCAFIAGECLDNANDQTCLIFLSWKWVSVTNIICHRDYLIFFITWCFVGDKPIWYYRCTCVYLYWANKCNVISVYSSFFVLITLPWTLVW